MSKRDEVVWEKKPDGLHFNDPELGEAMVAFPFPITTSWEWNAVTADGSHSAWGENIATEKEAKLRAISFLKLMKELKEKKL